MTPSERLYASQSASVGSEPPNYRQAVSEAPGEFQGPVSGLLDLVGPLTPARARAVDRLIRQQARASGWRPCPGTGGEHRYARDVGDVIRCLSCGEVPVDEEILERAPDVRSPAQPPKPFPPARPAIFTTPGRSQA